MPKTKWDKNNSCITVAELIDLLKGYKGNKEVIFTEGLHSDIFVGIKSVDKNTVKVMVR